MLVDEQDQVLSGLGADEEEQSWTLSRPEAQRNIFSSWRHVRGDGGQAAAVPAPLVGLLEGVSDGRARLEAS